MKVDTRSLRTLCEILLDHLEQSGGREIELANDDYWHIPAEQRHDMNQQPTKLSIGQLSDDWQALQRIPWRLHRTGTKSRFRSKGPWKPRTGTADRSRSRAYTPPCRRTG